LQRCQIHQGQVVQGELPLATFPTRADGLAVGDDIWRLDHAEWIGWENHETVVQYIYVNTTYVYIYNQWFPGIQMVIYSVVYGKTNDICDIPLIYH
jgi:hypothetical protein